MSKLSLYVLKLEEGKYYVGVTYKPINVRVLEHMQGYGSEWTKKYGPIEVIETVFEVDKYDEDKYVKIYMNKYGIENVRGGSYVTLELPDYQMLTLRKELCLANNKCFICNKEGHYAYECSSMPKNNQIMSDSASSTICCSYCNATLYSKEEHERECVKTYTGPICFKCGRITHVAKSCFAKIHKNGGFVETFLCYRCGRKGHFSPDCTAKEDIYGRIIDNKIEAPYNNPLFDHSVDFKIGTETTSPLYRSSTCGIQ
jgi:hypothetical protein